ncbi:MAG: hypothetical protein ACI8P9_004326 [Parasphingorhabdus sp.]|jgi:hypothetical protein
MVNDSRPFHKSWERNAQLANNLLLGLVNHLIDQPI